MKLLIEKQIYDKDIPKYLYHATYKPFLRSIMANGLGNTTRKMWSDSKGKGHVYLSSDPEVAYSYAETSEWLDDLDDEEYEEYIDSIVILTVDTTTLDTSKLQEDKNVLDDSSTYEYQGIIDKSGIVDIIEDY